MQQPGNRGPAPIVVSLAGDIDLAVREGVAAAVDDGVERASAAKVDLYIDLGAVTFMDSTGLACIARAVAALQDSGRSLRLCNPTAATSRILELSGLSPLVDCVGLPDEDRDA